jgi:hypothetical protein
MADRRAGRVPHVKKEPRSRTQSGSWRKKRSDTGKKRAKKKGLFGGLFR